MPRSVSSLAMALALAMLCACSSAEPSEPCEDVDCGPGQCVPSSGAATCSCPPGYIPADLSCRRDVREGDDHGDTVEAATPVEIMDPSQWVDANLDTMEDVDLFSFRVTAGRIFRFNCYSIKSSYDPACRVELLGADGLTLPGSVGAGGSSVYHAAVLATQDGTVYARVRAYSTSPSFFNPSYEYSLQDRGPDDFANTLTEATRVPVGTVSGYIEPNGDVDVVALDVVAGRAYRLSCSSGTPAVDHCGMRVRSPGGEVLYESKLDGTLPKTATFDLQGMQEGRYTVELFFNRLLFSDGTGDYKFSVADLEP
ncbi:hypothetical protein [Corallococcus aberystwythensis]|uniref:EGF-like domain-containing protein n=1 Tax=Corallococcus aberystwythensis TaxID=2316722 RepID=A0A3A8QGA9_9BACT|nr:hypothetical protein [Corallococcus aberystwythensis]RKH67667.1 hypothetical protein D7W81_13495 [Corallococcus aberystwythensis]